MGSPPLDKLLSPSEITTGATGSPKRAALRPNASVPETLRAVAHDVIAEARTAINNPVDAIAVHDFRKAMKRWRAFIRLLQPYLGDEGRRMRLEAAALARGLAGARDARTALDALDDLGKDKLSPRSLATLTARLELLRVEAEGNTVTPEARGRIDAVMAAAGESVKFWPLATLGYREIASELADGYRRARDAVPRDWMAADPETLHELRKRVVIHRYQMEIIEPLWPRFAQFWVGEAQRLRERLGHHQDLVTFAQLTAPHQALARWRSRLTPLIAARRADHVHAAARLAKRLFSDPPKAFRRRLLALWDPEAQPA
jgi:CHAD domain-containing protein